MSGFTKVIMPRQSWVELEPDLSYWPADLGAYVKSVVVPVNNMVELLQAVYDDGGSQ